MGWLSWIRGGETAGAARRVGEPKLTAAQRQQIVEYTADGWTLEELADEYDVSTKTIQRVLRAARQATQVDPVLALKRQLELKTVEAQLEAVEKDPEIRARMVEQLVGPPKDRPVDQPTIERVLEFLDREGRTVVDKRWLADLEERARKLEETLAEAEAEIEELREQVRAGGGQDAAMMGLLRDLLAGRLAVGQAGRAGAPGPVVQAVPAAAPGPAPDAPSLPVADGAAVWLRNLTAMDPAEAATLVYTSAANGMEVGSVSLAQAVMLLLGASSPQQVAALLAGVPGLEAVQAVAVERPEWVALFLEALRSVHQQRAGAAVESDSTAAPVTA